MAKVLLVDDSPLLLRISCGYLTRLGHNALTASNGREAVDKAAAERPDFIFMDAEMPEMDGWQACAAIKKDPATRGIPIYVCTGHELTDEVREKLKAIGADGCLQKPYKPEDLMSLIDKK